MLNWNPYFITYKVSYLALQYTLYQYCTISVRAQYAQDSNVLSLCLDCRMLEKKVSAQGSEILSPALYVENTLPSFAKGDSLEYLLLGMQEANSLVMPGWHGHLLLPPRLWKLWQLCKRGTRILASVSPIHGNIIIQKVRRNWGEQGSRGWSQWIKPLAIVDFIGLFAGFCFLGLVWGFFGRTLLTKVWLSKQTFKMIDWN